MNALRSSFNGEDDVVILVASYDPTTGTIVTSIAMQIPIPIILFFMIIPLFFQLGS